MSEVVKIELNLTKNGNPVKQILKVSPKIKYSSFLDKTKFYTKKDYRLEYFAEGKRWEELTESALRPLLKNYKNEQINIVTELQQEHSVDNSEISVVSRKQESSLSEESQSFNREQEEIPSKPPSPTEPDSHQQGIIYQDLATTILSAQEVVPSVAPQQGTQGPKNDFSDTVRDIVRFTADYITRELQKKYKILRERQQAIDLNKTCQECKNAHFKGPYFVCLVCPGEYVLCPNCEADDSMPDKILNTHKEKSHPFAKIKRLNQTIKTKAVTTISERDIGFEKRREMERGVKKASPEQQGTEQEIYNQLIKHFQTLYEQLLKRSDYHRKVLENPQLIRRLKRDVMHRDNLIPDANQAQAYGSGTMQSTFMDGTKDSSIQGNNDSMQFGLLSEKEKLQKLKKLKRMDIPEELFKKYTSSEYQNKTYKELMMLIQSDTLQGAR